MGEGSEGENLEWLSDYMLLTLKSPSWSLPIAQFVDSQTNKLETVLDVFSHQLRQTCAGHNIKYIR